MHLKEYLKSTGMKSKFLAEKSGVHRRTITQITKGKTVCQHVADSVRKITGPMVLIEVSHAGKGRTGRPKKNREKD